MYSDTPIGFVISLNEYSAKPYFYLYIVLIQLTGYQYHSLACHQLQIDKISSFQHTPKQTFLSSNQQPQSNEECRYKKADQCK